MAKRIEIRLERTVTQSRYITVSVPDSVIEADKAENGEDADEETTISDFVSDHIEALFDTANSDGQDWDEDDVSNDDHDIQDYDASGRAEFRFEPDGDVVEV